MIIFPSSPFVFMERANAIFAKVELIGNGTAVISYDL